MERDEIIIRNAVLHILDTFVGMPVLSDTCLELTEDLNDFLRGHIYKIISGDELKNCSFSSEESEVYNMLKDFSEDKLLDKSRDISSYLFTIMQQNPDIPPADFFMVTYQLNSRMYLAMLKMNYKEFYVHYTNSTENRNINELVRQTAALPTSKLSEAAFISLDDFSVTLVERKYAVNDVKTNYFSEMFLKCHTALSQKSKLDIVAKAVEQITKKYYDDSFDKKMESKCVIFNDIEEQGSLIPESIGDKLFGDVPEIKEEFTEKLEKYNIATAEVKPQNRQTTKKFEKQFLTTDTGIEINIPMEEYNSGENIEFITNPDGTISVLIKNINKLTSK